jgi:hypothetical protein
MLIHHKSVIEKLSLLKKELVHENVVEHRFGEDNYENIHTAKCAYLAAGSRLFNIFYILFYFK